MPVPASSVAVVILNYNGQAWLERFLPGVIACSPGARVVVADNASTDGSEAWVREACPQAEWLAMPQNYGFCGGYNRALAQIEAEVYVLLNSDVEVTEGWLDPMLAALEADPGLAAVQPKIRAWRSRGHFEHAGAAGGFIDRLGYPFCRGRLFDEVEEDAGQYDADRPIFWASGACLCIRARLYREFGGLDEMFFAHMEEIDLCWRLQRAGYRIGCVGGSAVYHVGGGTLQESNPRKTYLNFRNNLLLLVKNLPAVALLPTIFLRLCLDGLAGLRLLASGKPRHCWAIVEAHFGFYARLGQAWRGRRRWAHLGNGLKIKTLYPGSVVWQAFARGRKRFSQLPWPR